MAYLEAGMDRIMGRRKRRGEPTGGEHLKWRQSTSDPPAMRGPGSHWVRAIRHPKSASGAVAP